MLAFCAQWHSLSLHCCVFMKEQIHPSPKKTLKNNLIKDSLSVQPFSVINSSTSLELIPFRLRESHTWILVQSNVSDFENATKRFQDVMVPVVAKLKLSKNDVIKKIHTEIWKRPANFTKYPIPSFEWRFLLNCQTSVLQTHRHYLLAWFRLQQLIFWDEM